MWHVSGWITTQADRFEEGIGYYEKALEIEPNFVPSYGNLADVYLAMHEYDQANAMWQRFKALTGFEGPATLPVADALQDPSLKPVVLERIANDPDWPTGANGKARDFMLLGEPALAMDELERALAEKDPYAVHANRMAVYDPLRDNPRFQAHLAKMNLWPPVEHP
jgi:tetratricopeptide (TPR) repeat protein